MVTTLQFQELSYYYCYGFSFVKLQPIFLIKKNKGAKYIEIMCHWTTWKRPSVMFLQASRFLHCVHHWQSKYYHSWLLNRLRTTRFPMWIPLKQHPYNRCPCEEANSAQICHSHSMVYQVLGEEMTKSIDEGQESGQIERSVFQVECTQKAQSTGQKCPDPKSATMYFSHCM